MKHLTIILLALLTHFVCLGADNNTPKLEFVFDLNVTLQGKSINVGKVPEGNRTIIPITGGTFSGPNISGTIIAGGADYQLSSNGITTVDAIYSLRTKDNVNIFIENKGVISQDPNNSYFFTTPRFEAPVDSKYNWMNQSIFVCRPISFDKGITLRVWRVVDGETTQSTTQVSQQSNSPITPFVFNAPADNAFPEAKKVGKVEEFNYQAVNINNQNISKRAKVYLPYGYNQQDKTKKYNVIYLIHGGGDNTSSFFSDPRSPLPLIRVLDHLIASGKIDPVIVVTPTFYDDDAHIGANSMNDATKRVREFNKEFAQAVIPAIETHYNTYLKDTDQKSIEESREHRAFGGFSMGALCTWFQLAYGINVVKHFIPLSGDLWIFDEDGGKQSSDMAALWLSNKISSSAYQNDFNVYGYTGTDDIAGNAELNLFVSLGKFAPMFHINQPNGNAAITMKDGGKHYYGDINQYLAEALLKIWKKQ